MELILMVNLAFSIVGFFFIFRMWREVKTRRDMYGENFNIPRGKDNTQFAQGQNIDMRQLAAMVAENVREPEPEPEPEPKPEYSPTDGDLQRIVAEVMRQQKGGA